MLFSHSRLFTALLLSVFLFITSCASTQPAMNESGTSTDDDGLKPYSQVITAEAKTDSGLITIHKIDDKLYYEIPDSLLGKDMLLISRLAKVPAELGAYLNAGRKIAERVVHWNRDGNRILLKPVSFQSVAADTLAISNSVDANTFEPVLAIFEIETESPDGDAVVIEVSDLYTSDARAISGIPTGAHERWEIRGLDEDRTFINYAHAYPQNVEVRHTLTFRSTGEPAVGRGVFSVQMHQSMVLLPNDLMTSRPCDIRVGFFNTEHINYGSDALKADEECFINRWNLVPSDKEAYMRGELVDPVEPIVFYVGREVPKRWYPYVIDGIEEWNEAFREAGFKNAIVAKIAPTEEEDPDWSAEDVRYSTLRWVASTTRNAMGPSVVDPRSGEIIESDIIWYHNHLRSYRNRLMIETGAANPKARTLQLPDDLIGETMQQVIAHEVGHALGLPHNMIASSSYPVDSLRSPTFTKKYGVAASIMDYARQNYVAQPGDGVERFIRQIGPYDLYAIEWGYRRFPKLDAAEREHRLDEMILAHADNPMYRFLSWPDAAADPRAQTEDLGADHVAASRLGIKNLKRVVPNLIEWTSTRGETYDALDEIYGELLGMWSQYTNDVANVIGGIYADHKTFEQTGPVYTPVPRDQQERAVEFLADYAFDTPVWLLNDDILARVSRANAVDRMRSLQVGVLRNLLGINRLQRLIEIEARWPDQAYPITALMDDVRSAVWSELETAQPQIDIYRRNLQRGYIDYMEWLLNQEETEGSDIRAAVRGQLATLQESIEESISGAADEITRLHLNAMAKRIEEILSVE
ncbi:MAG TPA: zinc-dependent metalloprotease [Balneolaceae bacterium]|nr:zinc-dependent metalloprotease [Balneolaceae bacterium]